MASSSSLDSSSSENVESVPVAAQVSNVKTDVIGWTWDTYEEWLDPSAKSEIDPDLRIPVNDVEPEGNIHFEYVKYASHYLRQDWQKINYQRQRPAGVTAIPSKSGRSLDDLSYEIDHKHIDYDHYPEAEIGNASTTEDSVKVRRASIFSTFQMTPPVPVDLRLQATPPRDKAEEQVAIWCQELTFAIGPVMEPLFCTMTVFDLASYTKLSEDFHFALNSPDVMDLLGSAFAKQLDPATKSRKAIFTLQQNRRTASHENIHLVIWINKVLLGDLEKHYETYQKTSALKDKDRARFKDEVHDYVKRLGKFQQNFLVTSTPLCKPDGSFIDGEVTIESFMRPKSTLKTTLDDLLARKQKKNGIDGKFKFQITPPQSIVHPNRISPSLAPVAPFNERDSERTREVEEFKPFETSPTPHTTLVNNLYFYPKRLDMTAFNAAGSARNLAVEVKLMDQDDDPTKPGLKLIYGNSASSAMLDRIMTCVWYHTQKPQFLDEVKIMLPTQITEKHHILLTVYHLNCKAPSKGKSVGEPETPVAYAFIPIIQDRTQILHTKGEVALAMKLPKGYLKENIFYADQKKVVMSFRVRLVSSLYPLNQNLFQFLRSSSFDTTLTADQVHSGLMALNDPSTDVIEQVRFMPVILRQLFVLISSTNAAIATEAFITLLDTFSRISSAANPNDKILETYVLYTFDAETNKTPRPLFEALADHWLALNRSRTTDKQLLGIKFSSILFQLILRSMTLYLYEVGQLNDESTRPVRFSAEYIDLLHGLTLSLAGLLKDHGPSLSYSSELTQFNVQAAYFYSDLAAIMDRGVVFELIFNFFLELDEGTNKWELFVFKAQHLKVLAQNPYFVELNIPKSPSYVNVREMAKKFWQRHFFIGLLLSQVEKSFLAINYPDVRHLTIDLLADTMYALDLDPRFSSAQKKSICRMFLPLVVLVVDKFEMLNSLSSDERKKLFACLSFVLKHVSESVLKDYWEKETEKRTFTFFALLQRLGEEFEYMGADVVSRVRASTLGVNPSLMISDISTVASHGQLTPRGQNIASSGSTTSNVGPAFSLEASASFNSVGAATSQKKKSLKESDTGTARPSGKRKRKMSDAMNPDALSPLASTNYSPHNSLPNSPAEIRVSLARQTVQVTGSQLDGEVKKEQYFCREISLTILDVCHAFIKNFTRSLRRREVFEKVFGVIPALMRFNQSQSMMLLLFQRLRAILPNFKMHLFGKANSVCGELVFEVLRYCNSLIDPVRDAAAAVYAQMFDINMQEMKNVDRMRLQSTIAIIKIVGESSSSGPHKRSTNASPRNHSAIMNISPRVSDTSFGRMLNVLAVLRHHFASTNAIAQTVFLLETKIRAIISDNQKMLHYRYDPEMMADLIYGISRQLVDSPDERIGWLQNLAQFHKERGNMEESAQATILCAALAQAYLKMLGRWEINMTPAWSFVSPAIAQEVTLGDVSALDSIKEEVCQGAIFSVDGFADLVKSGIKLMRSGGQYEACVASYRMLLPIYLETEDYKNQKDIYADLLQLTALLTDESTLKQRIAPNYYRIAFFGAKFGEDLNGKEFIYKEQTTVRVTDITERLKKQYGSAFGEENVVLLSNTQKVNPDELDAAKLYLQIAAVDPYLSKDERSNSIYKQNFGVRRFVMEQPFTKSGKAHGDIEDQYLRRTIFETAGCFPFVKKRSVVTKKEDFELSPIEAATALFEKKLQVLKAEMNASPPNLKTLQRELQGSLIVTVNAGPAAIISAFLSDGVTSKWPQPQREQLADLVIELERGLGFAVRLNKGFMDPTPDQLLLHSEFERGYKRFKDSMLPLKIFEQRKDQKAQQAVDRMADERFEDSSRRLASDATKKKERAGKRRSSAMMTSQSITAAFEEFEKQHASSVASSSAGEAASQKSVPPLILPTSKAAVVSLDVMNDVKKRRRLTAEKMMGTSANTPPPSRHNVMHGYATMKNSSSSSTSTVGSATLHKSVSSGAPPLIAIPETAGDEGSSPTLTRSAKVESGTMKKSRSSGGVSSSSSSKSTVSKSQPSSARRPSGGSSHLKPATVSNLDLDKAQHSGVDSSSSSPREPAKEASVARRPASARDARDSKPHEQPQTHQPSSARDIKPHEHHSKPLDPRMPAPAHEHPPIPAPAALKPEEMLVLPPADPSVPPPPPPMVMREPSPPRVSIRQLAATKATSPRGSTTGPTSPPTKRDETPISPRQQMDLPTSPTRAVESPKPEPSKPEPPKPEPQPKHHQHHHHQDPREIIEEEAFHQHEHQQPVMSPRSAPNDAALLQNAATSALDLIDELVAEVNAIPARLAVAFEVSELAPLGRAVKSIKEQLRHCSFLVDVPDLPAPHVPNPNDKFSLLKAIITAEMSLTRQVLQELRGALPNVRTASDMVIILRALKAIKAALG